MRLAAIVASCFAIAVCLTPKGQSAPVSTQVVHLRHDVAWHRTHAWYWQQLAGLRRSPTVYAERRTDAIPYLRYLVRKWSSRRLHAKHRALTRPAVAHRALWLCIHSGEGSWTAQTGNGYFGGLQMTYGWMGLVGNPALLSPDQQMAAAEEGYRRSGYSRAWLLGQWPNTAPPCLRYAV